LNIHTSKRCIQMLELGLSIRREILSSVEAERPQILSITDESGIKAKADIISDSKLRERLPVIEPAALILSEEDLEQRPIDDFRQGPSWIIDPIDGTSNFVNKLPGASISIAYAEDGQVRDGVVVSFYSDEHFVASNGQGAWVFNEGLNNSKQLAVRDTAKLSAAVVGLETEMAANKWEQGSFQPFFIAALRTPVSQSYRVYEACAPSGCFVAAGRLSALVHSSCKPWDIAAAGLMIQEAGGRVSNLKDGSTRDPLVNGVVGSNGLIHEEILDRLSTAQAQSTR